MDNWENIEKYRIELKRPVLLLRGPKGVLACGYFNVATFDKTGEACAIVTGVDNYEEMLVARVVAISNTAAALGVLVGDTGSEALEKMK